MNQTNKTFSEAVNDPELIIQAVKEANKEQRELVGKMNRTKRFKAWNSSTKEWVYFSLGDLAFKRPEEWLTVDVDNAEQVIDLGSERMNQIKEGLEFERTNTILETMFNQAIYLCLMFIKGEITEEVRDEQLKELDARGKEEIKLLVQQAEQRVAREWKEKLEQPIKAGILIEIDHVFDKLKHQYNINE